jgi:hypothetical protein
MGLQLELIVLRDSKLSLRFLRAGLYFAAVSEGIKKNNNYS